MPGPLARPPLLLTCALLVGGLLGLPAAHAAIREVEDVGLAIDLPDDWVPIPRAEILEAGARARSAGAADDWTVRAAWQPPPHLRWFTLPHLVLDSRPAPAEPNSAPVIEHLTGRAGPRAVCTHRAVWHRDGLTLRLMLLGFEDRREAFEAWVASVRSTLPAGR